MLFRSEKIFQFGIMCVIIEKIDFWLKIFSRGIIHMILDFPTDTISLVWNYAVMSLPNFAMAVYVFCKSQNVRLKTSKIIYVILSSVLFTVLFVVIRFRSNTLAHFLFFILVPVLLSILVRDQSHLFKSLVIGLVSISFVSIVDTVSKIGRAHV